SKMYCFNKEFMLSEFTNINKILRSLGSTTYIHISTSADYVSIIYGYAKITEVKNIKEMIMLKEIVRTPSAALSITATNDEHGILIRYDSIKIIFYNKWLKAVDTSDNEIVLMKKKPLLYIGYILQKLYLENKGLKTTVDILAHKKEIMKDIEDQLRWHERSHCIFDNTILQDDEVFLSRALPCLGHAEMEVVKEIITDFIPYVDTYKSGGPIYEMLQLPRNKSISHLFMYLSDNWYLSGNASPTFIKQTYLISYLLVPFISGSNTIEIEKMKEVIFSNDGISVYMIEQYVSILQKIKEIVKTANFNINIFSTYKQVSLIIKRTIDHDPVNSGIDQPKKEFYFWVNMLHTIKNKSPDSLKRILSLIHNTTDFIISKIKKSDHDFKKHANEEAFIIDECIKKKLIAPIEVPSYAEIITSIAKENVSYVLDDDEQNNSIQNIIDIIENNKEEKVGIDYNRNISSFWTILQRLLRTSPQGKLLDGFSLSPSQNIENMIKTEKEKTVEEFLNKIAQYIKKGSIQYIELLKVNNSACSEEKFNEIIKKVDTKNDSKLQEHIFETDFYYLPQNRIFEIYVPLEYGKCDWNTAQAIWRINHHLRPHAKNKEWIIDKLLLTTLIDEYVDSL
ncbi:hypothetical protein ACFL56_04040, partial [Candidatus Margulisiibacteriota bacterium]